MHSGVARATYDDVRLILKLYDLRREEKLREGRDDEWIDNAEQQGGHDGHQDCCYKMFFHCSFLETNALPQAQRRLVITISISLMPMKGAMIPPTP